MLENTYTTDDLVERIALMRKYYGKRLFAGGENVRIEDVVRDECEPPTLAALVAWQTALEGASIPPLVVYEALDAIEEDLTGMPGVTLYVPIRFAYEHIERFGKWFRSAVQPNILLTVRTDPRTGGGCAFVWQDTYYDFSLRYHIQAKREQVVAMFNHYTHA